MFYMKGVGINDGYLNRVRPCAMSDIETLGTDVDSPIIELGLSYYRDGQYTTLSEYIRPDWDKADEGTLAWWRKQDHWSDMLTNLEIFGLSSPTAAMDKIIGDFELLGINIRDKNLKFYALGPHFDMAMQDYHCDRSPWKYNKVRDLRTTIDDLNRGIFPDVRDQMPEDIPHSAGNDAERQLRQLVFIQQRTKVETTLNLPGN